MSAPAPVNFTIYYLSEHAVTLQFGEEISAGILDNVNNFNRLLNNNLFPGFVSTIPAYTTLSVFFNPVKVIAEQSLHGIDCFEKVSGYLRELVKQPKESFVKITDKIIIPVCYCDVYGPDLEELATMHHMNMDDIIKMHSGASYTVGMIGFVPGFAYLTGLPPKLESPRKQSPRKAVPAGSIGIAGKQTGIYSLQTPGGWQIIGRTPLILFDAHRQQPSLLKTGDEVVFKPISAKEFQHIIKANYADTFG